MNKIMSYIRSIKQVSFTYSARYIWPFIILLLVGLFSPLGDYPLMDVVYGAEITGVDVRVDNEELIVSTSVLFDETFINEAKNGIQKELIIYVDLFRVWKGWPDEYVIGNIIERRITGDVIKGEYILTSFDRNRKIIVERKFKSFESMIKWMSEIKALPLINIKGVESGEYYVRVTVESRLRRLPPVVGYLLFFIPEKEFSISKDSPLFKLGPK